MVDPANYRKGTNAAGLGSSQHQRTESHQDFLLCFLYVHIDTYVSHCRQAFYSVQKPLLLWPKFNIL